MENSNILTSRIESDTRLKQAQLAKKIGRYPYFHSISSSSLPLVEIGGMQRYNFGSNNYLGLTTHPEVIQIAKDAIDKYGTGVTGSRLLNGSLSLHEELEDYLAKFYNAEASIVFPTGYTANLGFISTLVKRNDTVLFDSDIHASLIDGVLLSQASFKRFKHNDVSHLEERILSLKNLPSLCIIEGIYSMLGDTGNVGAVSEICKKYNITLLVDEAHGFGVVGNKGRGTAEMQNVMSDIDVFSITFSKSLGSCGGAIIGKRKVIDYLKSHARPFMFTASNTPSSVASSLVSLKLLDHNPQFLVELAQKKEYLYKRLLENGLPVRKNDSAILSILIGSDFRVIQAWKMLFNRMVYCNPVVSPAVPHNNGVLRFSVMRTHTFEQIDFVADICKIILPLIEK